MNSFTSMFHKMRIWSCQKKKKKKWPGPYELLVGLSVYCKHGSLRAAAPASHSQNVSARPQGLFSSSQVERWKRETCTLCSHIPVLELAPEQAATRCFLMRPRVCFVFPATCLNMKVDGKKTNKATNVFSISTVRWVLLNSCSGREVSSVLSFGFMLDVFLQLWLGDNQMRVVRVLPSSMLLLLVHFLRSPADTTCDTSLHLKMLCCLLGPPQQVMWSVCWMASWQHLWLQAHFHQPQHYDCSCQEKLVGNDSSWNSDLQRSAVMIRANLTVTHILWCCWKWYYS